MARDRMRAVCVAKVLVLLQLRAGEADLGPPRAGVAADRLRLFLVLLVGLPRQRGAAPRRLGGASRREPGLCGRRRRSASRRVRAAPEHGQHGGQVQALLRAGRARLRCIAALQLGRAVARRVRRQRAAPPPDARRPEVEQEPDHPGGVAGGRWPSVQGMLRTEGGSDLQDTAARSLDSSIAEAMGLVGRHWPPIGRRGATEAPQQCRRRRVEHGQ